ncbi:carboxyl transferase domain-containing protein [Streptomyces sp. NBC_00103]|uniref:carboxyl transferase domain-containing protein n=1 Tax=Streptomyces sp. NBC_00103 TaxID=2975653 RepID=UPI00225A36B5|nr:carboxyl transferase domain-containing protein [Streptomyces sp. NBC_00103]MCX5370172.1 acetyl-CoA carboxylase carboxyl transferase subunit alpha/beta [Streptomyces sp. NBC_00103]
MTTRRASAREVVALVADDFTRFPDPPGGERASAPDGPLGWPGYDASRERAARRTGESESVVCGTGSVEGTRAVLIAFEFGFLGGSLGERTGDRLEAAYSYAREHRLPVVPLVATGGSRMQEGMLALTQLQRVARQSALTREAGLPQIAVLRDPTTGGGWATLGAGADVVLALPAAQVGFAGSRVRPPDADPAAYTAEAQVAAGAADAVVPPAELREVLGRWLRLLTDGTPRAHRPAENHGTPGEPGSTRDAMPFGAGPRPEPHREATAVPAENHGTPGEPAAAGTGAVPCTGGSPAGPPSGSLREPAPVPVALGVSDPPRSGWEAVRRARAAERPRARVYLDAYFSHRLAISGDRCGGVDPDGMLCGFGVHRGRTVGYAAQTGAATRPAGYRTAARLIRLADRLGIPVLTLVDTPGAANDAEAERQGAGAAIAELFGVVATARTPITTLVIGEGGSGGALALAAPGRTWATPDSYFSVIAPESAAAILKRPPAEVEATADQLRIRPQDLVELGVIRVTEAR